ncbi:MAG: HD domain-containing protein [Sulfurospirillaceae bacterium]|nr:HD domain-containing protein [Sulfurospirillaceae bacterium]
MSLAPTNTHLKIPPYTLNAEEPVPFNVYRKDDDGEEYFLIVENGDVFPKSHSTLLNTSDDLYIQSIDELVYYYYLEKYLGDICQNKHISLIDKSKLIYDTSSNIIHNLLEKPESKEAIKRTKSLVDNTINIILSHDTAIKSMMEIGSHDYYTYTHSVDVAVFSIGFANYLKFSYNDILNVGNAAMLHDIGKSKIPNEVINKKGKLNQKEFNIIKQHPLYSYEILQFHGENNDDILKPARNHHEKVQGQGYPDNLMGHQIHDFAKIIAIADIFSALTTERSYKEAYHSFEALQLMKTAMMEEVDKKLLIEFIKFMSLSCR